VNWHLKEKEEEGGL